MSLAIIGGGVVGLSLAHALLGRGRMVTLFDRGGSLSAGVLHPYVGKEGKKSFRADEAMGAARRLIASTGTPIREGVERLMELEGDDIERLGEGHSLIHSGLSLDVADYMRRLRQGVHTVVEELKALPDFDEIVICAGGGSLRFIDLPLVRLKGQLLVCRAEKPLKRALIGDVYAVPQGDLLLLGATYERRFTSEKPDQKEAERLILPRAASLLPFTGELEVVGCQAGVRLARKGSPLPFVDQIREGLWVATGFGSRGLLYHAWVAELLANALVEGSPESLPSEFRCTYSS